MTTYSDHEQRQLDIASGARMDGLAQVAEGARKNGRLDGLIEAAKIAMACGNDAVARAILAIAQTVVKP